MKMKSAHHERRKQKILLSVSLVIILIGVYGMIIKGIGWMFTLPSHSMGNRFNLPYIILFVLALITTYFSAKNLFGKKKSKKV